MDINDNYSLSLYKYPIPKNILEPVTRSSAYCIKIKKGLLDGVSKMPIAITIYCFMAEAGDKVSTV